MKRMIRLLAGCLLSLCLLLPGVTALAAPDDTGVVSDPSLPAAAGRAGTPAEETGSPSGTEVGARRARPPRSARGGNRTRNHAFPCRFRFLRKAGPAFSWIFQ